jgi:hypothetical protein
MDRDNLRIHQVSGKSPQEGAPILSPRILAAILLLTFVFTLLRCIHLDADTPEGVSNSEGIYVDEGYKTLAPRNLVLFGKSNWHSADDYRGWAKTSPLTNWPYYLAFKLFGVRIQAARMVTVGYFFLFLLMYLIATAGRYRDALVFFGLAALSLQSTIFFFSRVALLEMPVVAVVYGCLFLQHRLERRPVVPRAAVLVGAMVIAIFGIKASALLYFGPVCLAFALVVVFRSSFAVPRWKVWACVLGFLAMVVILALATRHIWLGRITQSAANAIRRALVSPPAEAEPLTVVLGLLCACQLLLFYPQAVLGSVYRCSLVALITICPLALALFPYNPLRYYVPVIPAYVLLILEFFHLKATYKRDEGIRWPGTAIACVLLFFCAFSVGVLLNKLIISNLPFQLGDEPGLSPRAMVRYFTPIAAAGAAAVYALRRYALSASVFTVAVCLLVGFAALYNGYLLGKFWLRPSYQALDIQRQISRVAGADASVAGDWAPFLTLNTSIRSLYLNKYNNRKNIRALHPTFFLDNGNRISDENREEILKIPGASLGKSVFQAHYHQAPINLYPIIYGD